MFVDFSDFRKRTRYSENYNFFECFALRSNFLTSEINPFLYKYICDSLPPFTNKTN